MKQFTATIYIIENKRALLIYHKKRQKWLPPGGHLDPDELPSSAALREAEEETGLIVELIPQENIWIEERGDVRSFPRPYMCLLESIPEHNGVEAHEHIDFIYLGRPIGGTLKHNSKETENLRWFTIEEIGRLEKNVEIFPDTFEALEHILTSK